MLSLGREPQETGVFLIEAPEGRQKNAEVGNIERVDGWDFLIPNWIDGFRAVDQRIQREGTQTTLLCQGPSRIRILASLPLLAYSRIRMLVPDGSSM